MKVSCTNCNNELLVEDPADSNFCFCRSCDRHFDGSIIESLRQSGDSPASGSDTVEDGGTLEFHPAADSGRSELEPGEATETRERPLRTLGNFTILDHLGAGQLGKVYRARNTRLEREVAFKVPKEFVDDSVRSFFLREARAAAQLNHPNIVGIHEVDESEDSVYLVTEFVQGMDLREWLQLNDPGTRQVAQIGKQILSGLEHAHEAGVIHR